MTIRWAGTLSPNDDLKQDELLLAGLVAPETEKKAALEAALKNATEIGFILLAVPENEQESDIILLNSPRGRDALAALKSGKWRPEEKDGSSLPLPPVWPGIFQLYEENIGPLTPMLADILQEAEKNYPQSIIQYAFEEAVKQNARSWKYIDAILRNWQEKGSNGQNSRDPEKDRRKYIEGEYA